MVIGALVWAAVILITIFIKTAAYVDEEARAGVGRLIFVLIGTVAVLVGIIIAFKLVVGAI